MTAVEMSDNPKPIIGYSDKLSVQPGEKVSFMVSSDFPKYHADIVRLYHSGSAPELGRALNDPLERADGVVGVDSPSYRCRERLRECVRR